MAGAEVHACVGLGFGDGALRYLGHLDARAEDEDTSLFGATPPTPASTSWTWSAT